MGREHSSGQQFVVGDLIKGYEILKVFDPGAYAFAGKARAPNGQMVFFKKYRRPGGSSPWLGGFIDYQLELKRKIQSEPGARNMCYEFVEFFDLSQHTKLAKLRAFYQVFEWIEGGSDLRQMLNQAASSPASATWAQRVLFAKMLAQGINTIHKAGVIHTDLKPENFYLIPDASLAARYKLRVIDMDFSLLEGRRAPWDGSGEGYVGTPGYMSPEHLHGQVPSKPSDVFTCGLILSELLCGTHPAHVHLGSDEAYEKAVKAGRLKAIEVREPIEKVPDLPFLNAVLNGCLRPEAARRPTIEQVLRALNGVLESWDGQKPKVATPTPSPIPPPSLEPAPSPKPAAPAPAPKPAPVPAPAPNVSRVTLKGPGEPITAAVAQIFGRAHFKRWGEEFERFMSNEQFRVFRDASGNWMIEHCMGAVNATNVDGTALSSSVGLRSGMTISLGRTGKCPITVNVSD
jgi:serine/threonine protein kinase